MKRVFGAAFTMAATVAVGLSWATIGNAACGKVTIAEVEELCEIGELDPDHIHTPGIYVNRILEGSNYTKAIENLTLSES